MNEDKRIDVAKEFFQRCFHGHVSEAKEMLEPDASYHVPGTSPLSGSFRGRDAVVKHLEDLLRSTDQRVNVVRGKTGCQV